MSGLLSFDATEVVEPLDSAEDCSELTFDGRVRLQAIMKIE